MSTFAGERLIQDLEERADLELAGTWRDGKPARETTLCGRAAAALRALDAVPIDQWTITADERVLIFVVAENAAFAKTPEERAQWEGWCVGHWTTFNKGGWIWHGHMGRVTHVARLPKVSDA